MSTNERPSIYKTYEKHSARIRAELIAQFKGDSPRPYGPGLFEEEQAYEQRMSEKAKGQSQYLNI
jgi:hypothetical protein